jgi:ribulose-5-phosphate 4-epimerase/fuculose-1-phosphate aldolase
LGSQPSFLACSGSMSSRLENDIILLNGEDSWLSNLHKDQVSISRLTDGMLLNSVLPCSESSFHYGIMRERKDVSVILYFQSSNANTLACMPDPPTNFNVISEVVSLIGPITYLPYACPGLSTDSQKVTQAMKKNNLLMIRHQGQIVVGKTYEEVIRKALFFEFACSIINKSNNTAIRLSESEIQGIVKFH